MGLYKLVSFSEASQEIKTQIFTSQLHTHNLLCILSVNFLFTRFFRRHLDYTLKIAQNALAKHDSFSGGSQSSVLRRYSSWRLWQWYGQIFLYKYIVIICCRSIWRRKTSFRQSRRSIQFLRHSLGRWSCNYRHRSLVHQARGNRYSV